ncbi:MAG: hypothetical protein HY898_34935 [Deltaproteobacteria bacterium]|nr:hypothetical protein [Deltaproteobacteria bacterium]
MRTVGSLMMALSALAMLAGVGCSTDGYTPKCTAANDWADCLDPPEGGVWVLDSSTDAAVDQVVQPEAAAETGPDTEPPDSAPPDSDPPDTAADSPSND